MAEVKSLKERMAETARRAKAIREDPNLRHEANEHDLKIMRENALLMMPYQYETIKEDKPYDRI